MLVLATVRRRLLISVGTTGTAVGAWCLSTDVDSSTARFARTLWYSSLVGIEYKFGEAAHLPVDSPERRQALDATHQRSAERLLHVCRLHGGLYTKLGIHIRRLNQTPSASSLPFLTPHISDAAHLYEQASLSRR